MSRTPAFSCPADTPGHPGTTIVPHPPEHRPGIVKSDRKLLAVESRASRCSQGHRAPCFHDMDIPCRLSFPSNISSLPPPAPALLILSSFHLDSPVAPLSFARCFLDLLNTTNQCLRQLRPVLRRSQRVPSKWCPVPVTRQRRKSCR